MTKVRTPLAALLFFFALKLSCIEPEQCLKNLPERWQITKRTLNNADVLRTVRKELKGETDLDKIKPKKNEVRERKVAIIEGELREMLLWKNGAVIVPHRIFDGSTRYSIKNPCSHAAMLGLADLLEWLLHNPHFDARDEKNHVGAGPLHLAARCTKEDKLQRIATQLCMIGLVNQPDNLGDTPICYAAALGNTTLVTLLLENGAIHDPHTDYTYSIRTLHGTKEITHRARGGSPLRRALQGRHAKTVKRLLDHISSLSPAKHPS